MWCSQKLKNNNFFFNKFDGWIVNIIVLEGPNSNFPSDPYVKLVLTCQDHSDLIITGELASL